MTTFAPVRAAARNLLGIQFLSLAKPLTVAKWKCGKEARVIGDNIQARVDG